MARQSAEANGNPQPRGLVNGWIGDQIEDREELGNPLTNVEDSTLREACRQLSQQSKVPYEQLINAAEVAKHRYDYYSSSKDALAGISSPDGPPLALKVKLSLDDKKALVAERERLFSGRGMLIIILTVSLAAFLQGHVQSSINAGSLFAETVGITEPRLINLTASGSNYTFDLVRDAINGINNGIHNDTYLDGFIPENGTYYRADQTEKIPQGLNMTGLGVTSIAKWQLGGMNAIPFLTAAFPGAPLSLPVNYCFGRRGALGISALLIIASSLGSAFASTWQQVLGARIVGGIAMGIKAVSAPILASETAVGYWRGSTILAWQLWVACGIMIGFVVNLVIASATNVLDTVPSHIYRIANESGTEIMDPFSSSDYKSRYLAFQLILGAPLVPSILLLIALCFCYESPRFYMRPGTPNYNLERAFEILRKVRKNELQATRDFFLIWWSIKTSAAKQEAKQYPLKAGQAKEKTRDENVDSGLTYMSRIGVVLKLSARQFRPLFNQRHLRNALLSSCTVALAQQLCGINVFAFYSNELFSNYGVEKSMGYSFGFGGVNFFFALLAMRSIDIIGRRRWLLSTLPMMSVFLMASAIAYAVEGTRVTERGAQASESIAGIVFIYLFAAAYSPGLGPIPFTLASESFPLSNREAGASVAISINLLFAGILTILIPSINREFKIEGTLGFFAGMNVIAFILVWLFVEETKRLPLEELEKVYDNPKFDFAKYQLSERLPYHMKRLLSCFGGVEEPKSYDEIVLGRWRAGDPANTSDDDVSQRPGTS
ncbi:hypothetical protein CEP52_005957 [Fusarium oligoseptatum]|uniref:Major facilitator superfamily (MFS) profile domain-containing protein n=1 Tax=Fusarium oligoseptatum TaxID=2604345 RepID=A0A428TVI9_9HYPO|nr:hypothetical protein CEP52_005957 [Fusarium oligoseptatum]